MSSLYNDEERSIQSTSSQSDDDDENSKLFSGENKNGEEKTKSNFRQFKDFFRKRVKTTGLRLMILVILNGLYLYLGGLVFYVLEKKTREEDHVRQHIEHFLTALQKSHPAVFAIKNITNFVYELPDDDIDNIHTIFGGIHDELTQKNQDEWTLESSVFFATTVVTTIGYGNLAPETVGGRIFCVIYAIIGIPTTLILLTIVGQILSKYINDLCNVFIKAIRITFYPSYEYESLEEDGGGTDLKAPVWLALSFIMVFISLDAFIYVYVEGWSFPIALYFLFISLTTIGFGDIVPKKTSIVWFNVLFLYIGLAAVSITINLLIANINRQYKKHKEKIKFVKKLEDEFGSKRDVTSIEENENNEDGDEFENDYNRNIKLEETK